MTTATHERLPALNSPFPSFYLECAFRDGVRDALAGNEASRASYMRHGAPEPTGMRWYEAGRATP